MDIFCSSTTARAGTVVESSCYFGRNEAVEYRDSEYPGGVKLGMLVQLRLLKERRNRGNPSVSPAESIDPITNCVTLDLRSKLRSVVTPQAFVSSKLSWDSHSRTWLLQVSESAISRTSITSISPIVFSPCLLSGPRSGRKYLCSVVQSVIRQRRSTLPLS
jgi:hypothetical protein